VKRQLNGFKREALRRGLSKTYFLMCNKEIKQLYKQLGQGSIPKGYDVFKVKLSDLKIKLQEYCYENEELYNKAFAHFGKKASKYDVSIFGENKSHSLRRYNILLDILNYIEGEKE